MVETQCSKRVQKLRRDNVGEYTSNEFKNFCRSEGIEIQYTVARIWSRMGWQKDKTEPS